jgi:hypothetical protein
MFDETRRASARARELALTPPPSITRPPTYLQLMLGWEFFWNHPASDLVAWARERLADAPNEGVRAALDRASERGTVRAALGIMVAYEAAAADTRLPRETRDECQDHAIRARISAAFLGDVGCALQAALDVDTEYATRHCDAERRLLLVTRQELMETARHASVEAFRPVPSREYLRGQVWLDVVAQAAVVDLFREAKPTGPVRGDWFLDDIDEPEAADDGREYVTVLESVGRGGRADSIRETEAAFKGLVGTAVPLVPSPSDPAAIQAALDARSPHLAGVTRALLSLLARGKSLGGPPVIIVGPAGAGKTAHIAAFCEAVGLPLTRYQCDASSDNALAGTARRWQTTTMSVPLGSCREHLVGNPAIMCDEVEKAAGSRSSAGGRLWDALHGLWEPESARRWRDPMAEAEADLSHVVWLCTANDLAGFPRTLLDRARVIHAPLPERRHAAVLAANIAREIAIEDGMDPAWGVLDDAEMTSVKAFFEGGSLRHLRRLVEVALSSRAAAWH